MGLEPQRRGASSLKRDVLTTRPRRPLILNDINILFTLTMYEMGCTEEEQLGSRATVNPIYGKTLFGTKLKELYMKGM